MSIIQDYRLGYLGCFWPTWAASGPDVDLHLVSGVVPEGEHKGGRVGGPTGHIIFE